MISSRPRLVLAALKGGAGKTTISLGLISAWRQTGLVIAPFKKGPDYIDAGWLARAAGQPCYNLDPYLIPRHRIRDSFLYRTSEGTHGALIEGNRGLYDGTDVHGTYSTAELAKLLEAPVVLLVDCTKSTRTLAAVVLGCRHFDRDVNLAGVVLNQVATSRQEALVRQTIEAATGIPVLGAVPRFLNHDLPERHLGLIPHQEHPEATKVLNYLGLLAQSHLDLAGLWKLACSAPPLTTVVSDLWSADHIIPTTPALTLAPVRVGVVRDSAFQFYYPENIELLERLGAEVVPFSSLDTARLPQLDALYLGGGFPETHAELLANNTGLRADLKRAADAGLPIYAECGGLMFLGRSLVLSGNTYPMAGVFPVDFSLERRPQGHGYTRVVVDGPTPFFPPGTEFVGHEFHYSRPLSYDRSDINLVFKVNRGQGFDAGRDGLAVNNVLASYTHLHALGTTLWAEALVRLVIERRAAVISADRSSQSKER